MENAKKEMIETVDKEQVEQMRKDGQPDNYIAWCLGCEVEDLPKEEKEEEKEKVE